MQMLVTALVAIAAHPIDAADEPVMVRVYPVADLVTGPPQNHLGLAPLQEAGLHTGEWKASRLAV